MQTYIDLHRHAAARAALTRHPKVALRLLVAHAITGSWLWKVKTDPQTCRNEAVRESVEVSPAEVEFDEKRRAVLALLGFSADRKSTRLNSSHSCASRLRTTPSKNKNSPQRIRTNP